MGEQVKLYSGSRYGERPRSFCWQNQVLEVVAIIARWRTPEHLHFRVMTQENQIFDLEYEIIKHRWSINPQ